MGNWFATMIGALAGIGIALGLNKRQEGQEKEVLKHEEENRKIKILTLIKEELEYNRSAISSRQPLQPDDIYRNVPSERLKDELWNAFSDGGELQWIKDLQLLEALSIAYYRIRVVMFLEEAFLQETLFMDTLGSFPGVAHELEKADNQLIEYIERAVNEIDKRLPSNAKAR